MSHIILTDETFVLEDGTVLHRIKAAKAIKRHEVRKGQLGGWVESEENVLGRAWVAGEARVFGDAVVLDDALVEGHAQVYGYAEVSGEATIRSRARVYDQANVWGQATIEGAARVYGQAQVYGEAEVGEAAHITGTVCDEARVLGTARVEGTGVVGGNALILSNAIVSAYAHVGGRAVVGTGAHVSTDQSFTVIGPILGKRFVTFYATVLGGLGAGTGFFEGTPERLRELLLKECRKDSGVIEAVMGVGAVLAQGWAEPGLHPGGVPAPDEMALIALPRHLLDAVMVHRTLRWLANEQGTHYDTVCVPAVDEAGNDWCTDTGLACIWLTAFEELAPFTRTEDNGDRIINVRPNAEQVAALMDELAATHAVPACVQARAQEELLAPSGWLPGDAPHT